MNTYARKALKLFLFLVTTLTGVSTTHSAEYYIYRDPKGVLVISNQKPAPDSEIIKQRTLVDEAEREPQEQPGAEKPPSGNSDSLNSTPQH